MKRWFSDVDGKGTRAVDDSAAQVRVYGRLIACVRKRVVQCLVN